MTRIFFETLPVADVTTDGGLRLVYDRTWLARRAAFPVSVTMPLQESPHPAERLLPWLANLLPESHLSEIGQQLKVSPQDFLGMLEHLGRDTAGAMSVGQPRRQGTHVRPVETEADLERIIDELPAKPFLIGETGVSMSLAGVQDKLPVFVASDGGICIPYDGTPSTHIMKPDANGRRLPGSVQNEAFCMTLARLCGLDVSDVTTGSAGKRNYLLVTRYDRVTDASGTVRRIHQEDLCQALGRFPSEKYERGPVGGRPGPGLKDMFGAIGEHVSLGERLKFLDAVIFNVLTCNTDSHAKNYSILIGAGGSTKMAPLYDLMCAAVYPQVDRMLPQRIGRRTDPAGLHGQDWQAMAAEAGLSPSATLRRVAELAEAVTDKAETAATQVEAMPAGGHPILVNIVHEVRKRCRRVLRQLSTGRANGHAGMERDSGAEEEGRPRP